MALLRLAQFRALEVRELRVKVRLVEGAHADHAHRGTVVVPRLLALLTQVGRGLLGGGPRLDKVLLGWAVQI